jgi:uncharacterized integral membrane protein
MLGLIKALITIPLAILIIVLAVANRGPVTLSLDPIAREASQFTVTLPLFVPLLAAVMAGVFLGGVASWLAQGHHRRAERQYRREAAKLRNEAERLRAQQPSDVPTLPAIRRA